MIFDSLYLGSIKVRKIIQNGRIVWQSALPIAATGLAEIVSNAAATGTLFVCTHPKGSAESANNSFTTIHFFRCTSINGVSESESHGVATAGIIAIEHNFAIAESTTYSTAIGRKVIRISVAGLSENESDGIANGRSFLVMSSEAISDIDSYILGTGHENEAKRGVVCAESVNDADTIGRAHDVAQGIIKYMSYTDSMTTVTEARAGVIQSVIVSESHPIVDGNTYRAIVGDSSVEGQTYTNTLGYCYKMTFGDGSSDSTACTEAAAIAAMAIFGSGHSKTGTDDKAIGNSWPVVSSDGYTEFDTYGYATGAGIRATHGQTTGDSVSDNEIKAIALPAEIGAGTSANTSYAVANLLVFYPPIDEGDCLFIQQAYRINDDGEILEVI